MPTERITLQAQIPSSFYKLFGTKYRPLLIEYLLILFEEIFQNSSHVRKGLTRGECRDIINSVPLSSVQLDENGDSSLDEEMTETYDSYDNKFLSYLIHHGWLVAKYDSNIGEDLITIPQYAMLFVRVFEELRQTQAQNNASIRDVYAGVVTYSVRTKDISFLKDAFERLGELNISLSSSNNLMEEKILSLMQADNKVELINGLLSSLQREENGDINEATEYGRFRAYLGYASQEVETLLRQSGEDLDQMRDMQEQAESVEEKNQWEKEIAGEEIPYETLRNIRLELQKTETLFNESIQRSAQMCVRALDKLKYLDARDSETETTTLIRLISMIAGEKVEGGRKILESARKELAFLSEPHPFMDYDIYERREKTEREEDFFYIAEDETNNALDDSSEQFRPKYTVRELRKFESEHVIDGQFVADAESVKTADDLDKLIYLYLRSIGDPDVSGELSIGEFVEIEEGLGFTELRWNRKGNEDEDN